jgi:hypothetical protein
MTLYKTISTSCMGSEVFLFFFHGEFFSTAKMPRNATQTALTHVSFLS